MTELQGTESADLPVEVCADKDAPIGSVLSPSHQEMVVLARLGNPPLRFKGRRLTHHWARLSRDTQIVVELWQQLSKGLVISYSVLNNGKIGRKAIQISNLAEATDCLENICANLEVALLRSNEFDPLWSEFHLRLCFKQRFNLLVADVLSDWHALPKLQEHA